MPKKPYTMGARGSPFEQRDNSRMSNLCNFITQLAEENNKETDLTSIQSPRRVDSQQMLYSDGIPEPNLKSPQHLVNPRRKLKDERLTAPDSGSLVYLTFRRFKHQYQEKGEKQFKNYNKKSRRNENQQQHLYIEPIKQESKDDLTLFNVQNEFPSKQSSSQLQFTFKSNTVLDFYHQYQQDKVSGRLNRQEKNHKTCYDFWNSKERNSSIQKNKWFIRDNYAQTNFSIPTSTCTSPLRTGPSTPTLRFFNPLAFNNEQKEIRQTKVKYEKTQKKNNFYYKSNIKDLLDHTQVSPSNFEFSRKKSPHELDMNQAIYSSSIMKEQRNKENMENKRPFKIYLDKGEQKSLYETKIRNTGNKTVEAFRNRTLNSQIAFAHQ